MNDINRFARRLKKIGISPDNIQVNDRSIYLYVPQGGYGITPDTYQYLDVYLTDSISKESLSPDHKMYKEGDYSFVLVFYQVKDHDM